MLCETHDSLITFNNGLGPFKTKTGGGFQGGSWWDFVFLIEIVMRLISHGWVM